MNDVGKTNFLYALRYVFDRDVRKQEFIETDFYKKNTDVPIEIIVQIDISDITDPDSEKIRAKVKGALLSDQDIVYIKLFAEYNAAEMQGTPLLYWGGNLDDLQEIPLKGYTSEIDNVFNVVYIDAYVNLYNLFRKNTAILLKNDDIDDETSVKDIEKLVNKLNDKISSLSGIKNFEKLVNPKYNNFRNDEIEISVKSELAVNGIYSNVVPYIKEKGVKIFIRHLERDVKNYWYIQYTIS